MAASNPAKALTPLLALMGACFSIVSGVWSTFSVDSSPHNEKYIGNGSVAQAAVQGDADTAAEIAAFEPTIAVSFPDLRFEAIRSRDEPIVKEGEIPARLKELSGRKVQIAGCILPGAIEYMEHFVLISQESILRNHFYPFSPDEVVIVEMADGDTVRYSTRAYVVRGTLQIEPLRDPAGKLWSIYKLADARAVKLADAE